MQIKKLSLIDRWRLMRKLKKKNKVFNKTVREISDFVDKLPPLSSQ